MTSTQEDIKRQQEQDAQSLLFILVDLISKRKSQDSRGKVIELGYDEIESKEVRDRITNRINSKICALVEKGNVHLEVSHTRHTKKTVKYIEVACGALFGADNLLYLLAHSEQFRNYVAKMQYKDEPSKIYDNIPGDVWVSAYESLVRESAAAAAAAQEEKKKKKSSDDQESEEEEEEEEEDEEEKKDVSNNKSNTKAKENIVLTHDEIRSLQLDDGAEEGPFVYDAKYFGALGSSQVSLAAGTCKYFNKEDQMCALAIKLLKLKEYAFNNTKLSNANGSKKTGTNKKKKAEESSGDAKEAGQKNEPKIIAKFLSWVAQNLINGEAQRSCVVSTRHSFRNPLLPYIVSTPDVTILRGERPILVADAKYRGGSRNSEKIDAASAKLEYMDQMVTHLICSGAQAAYCCVMSNVDYQIIGYSWEDAVTWWNARVEHLIKSYEVLLSWLYEEGAAGPLDKTSPINVFMRENRASDWYVYYLNSFYKQSRYYTLGRLCRQFIERGAFYIQANITRGVPSISLLKTAPTEKVVSKDNSITQTRSERIEPGDGITKHIEDMLNVGRKSAFTVRKNMRSFTLAECRPIGNTPPSQNTRSKSKRAVEESTKSIEPSDEEHADDDEKTKTRKTNNKQKKDKQ